MIDKCRKSTSVLIYKNKEGIYNYSNYRMIELIMSPAMKLRERSCEQRLIKTKKNLHIREQFDAMLRSSTIKAMIDGQVS